MTKSRLPLPLSTLVLLVACNQVTSALSMGGEEKPAEVVAAAPADGKTAPPAGAAAAVPTPVPVPTGPATVDELLGLVHEGATTYMVFKTPDSLFGLAEAAAGAFEQPLTSLVTATQPDRLSELTQGFTLFKSGLADARAALAQAGTDLARGIVITSTSAGSDDDPVVTFPASSPEAAKTLLAALKIPDAATVACQAAPAHPGYVTCAKDPTILAAYKPGDAKVARGRLNAALPAVTIDELAILGYVAEGDVHFGVGQPAGGFTVHVSAPPDARDMFAALGPGKAELLRFAPAGTGFLWMKLDVEALKQKGLSDVPAPFSASVGAFDGEVLFGGSAAPPALQARFGFTDTSSLAPLADLAIMLGGPMLHNKPIPDIPGSKVTFKSENLSLGTEKIKALHFGLSGVPQAKALAEQLGLALDAWLYPAEGTLAAVVGVDAKHVGDVKAAADSEATIAALPAALAASLRAGEVGFVAHVPLDGLQSPALGTLLDGALAKVPGYTPATARSALGVLAPLSSTTMWVTEHQNSGVIHFAVQTIGHTGDEEGKAALAAAASPDPAKAFGELATRYPASPRLAAYQARSGQGGTGALIGSSGPALLLAGGAVAALFTGRDASTPPAVLEIPPLPPVAEPPKVEPAKKDPAPKKDPPKTEPAKTEPTKTEPAKTEPTKTEPTKTEPTKTEPTKTEPIKADPVKDPVPRPTGPIPVKRVGREDK